MRNPYYYWNSSISFKEKEIIFEGVGGDALCYRYQQLFNILYCYIVIPVGNCILDIFHACLHKITIEQWLSSTKVVTGYDDM